MKVSYEGYNPATKKMAEPSVPVAEYSYDKQGRLRAEWDPRVSRPLKTTYGYDAEGHVTVVNPPGQEPWIMQYGQIKGDSGAGRLLSVTRPAATSRSELEKAEEYPLPVSSGISKPTGTAVEGGTLTAQTGEVGGWYIGHPLSFNYQWENCTSKGHCNIIVGATSPTFQPTAAYANQEIRVKVTATNCDGSVSVNSGETEKVKGIAPTYVTEFGKGTLGTKFVSKYAEYGGAVADAVDSSGNVWVLSTQLSGTTESTKVFEFNASGTLLHTYPVSGVGTGIAINQSTNEVYIADAENNKVWELNSKGEALGSFALAEQRSEIREEFKNWIAIAIDANGNVWTSVFDATEVEEFSESGKHITGFTVGEWATYEGPSGLTVANGYVYVTISDPWSESHLRKFDYAGKEHNAATPSGKYGKSNLDVEPAHSYFYTFKENLVQERLLTETKSNGESNCPSGGCESVSVTEFGSEKLTAALNLAAYPASHNLYVIDNGTGEVEKWTAPNPEYKPPPPPKTGTNAQTTIEYNVPVSGSEAPHNMSSAEIAKWGQKAEETPEEATAIFPPDSPQSWPATTYTRATIYYLDNQGRLVNTATPSTGTYGAISTAEYNETNDVVRTLSPDNRAAALSYPAKSVELASLYSTFSTYRNKCSSESEFAEEREATEPGTRLCEIEGPAHTIKYTAGKEQLEAQYARDHTIYFYDQKVPSEGPNNESFSKETFNRLTKSLNIAKVVNQKGEKLQEVEPRITTTAYSGQNNLGWKLREPTSVTVDPEGAKITHTTLYYEEGHEAMGQVMETRGPEGATGNSAHDQKIVYYSAEENKEDAACGSHPGWAGLVCQTLPAKQPPETAGVPKLPETTTTYNMWSEPEAVEEVFPKSTTFGEKTRTTRNEYDAAGRMKSSEKASTATTESTDKALPRVANIYNEAMGVLEKQSTTVGEKTKTITSAYNTLAQLETYTDADGNATKYKYGGPTNDRLLEEISDGSDNGETKQKYTYIETTKQIAKRRGLSRRHIHSLLRHRRQAREATYPNGMCAKYTDNAIGEATKIEYAKTGCSGVETWFSETRVPSARGETMSRATTLANDEYTYDTLGRLTEVHETPTSEYCKTRLYTYDEESNRKEATTREPNTKKECATEGGTTQKHTYDEASRLTDTGIAYDPLGNVTTLPSSDAEGHPLESTFYVDNAVATQTQNGVTNDYYLDPEGRVRETTTGAKKTISHYDAPGQAIAWSCEGTEKAEACETGGKWTREIAGIDGTLTAIQNGTGTAAETPILQLHDLQGDVVGTIRDKEGETKLESTYNSTEFGVPNGGKEPPKLAWLGAGGIEKSLASGVITQGATSYVPQIDKALQTEEVAPPGLPEGSGAGPAYIMQEEPWVLQGATREADEAPGLEAEREREAEEAACRANPAACELAPEEVWIDPERSVLLTTRQAALAATAARHGPGALEALAKSGVIRGFTGFLAERLAEIGNAYLQGLAYGLELCYTAIDQVSGEGRCKVYVDWVVEPIENQLKVVAWGVETCWGASYKRRNSVHWTFPYCYPAGPG